MILNSINIENGECPYLLKDEDFILLRKIVRAKQIPLLSFGKAEDGEVGSFVPIAIMHEVKRDDIVESSKEMDRRLGAALKKLL